MQADNPPQCYAGMQIITTWLRGCNDSSVLHHIPVVRIWKLVQNWQDCFQRTVSMGQ